MIDFAVENLRLARPAKAVAARMRQIDAGAQAGVEDRLTFGDVDDVADRLDGKLMRHDAPSSATSARRSPCSR